MPIYYGGSKIKEIYNGSVPIKEVYNGSNKVFGSGAVIEYGVFELKLSSLTANYFQTFFPDFETSTDKYEVVRYMQDPFLGQMCYQAMTSNNILGYQHYSIDSYMEKQSFVFRAFFSLECIYNATYSSTVTLGGVLFDKYNLTRTSAANTEANVRYVYIPQDFVVNKSWFLIWRVSSWGDNPVPSRDSSFGYHYEGNNYTLKSRHTINLLTGEEQ